MREILALLFGGGIGVLGTYAYLKKPRRPPKRHQHFLTETDGTIIGISPDLLSTVRLLLEHAIAERGRHVLRTKNNHATTLAPTIVITVTAAL
ncbi:MAG: hypothetical protein ABI823_08665, partial [Bryobacteraceae bacterium]